MNKEEVRLKIQALADNELSEEEIPQILSAIEGSYELREEYIEVLRVKKRLKGLEIPQPSDAWYDRIARRRSRKAGSFIGMLLFLGSYAALLIYGIYSMFTATDIEPFIKLAIGASIIGLVILLTMTITDRLRESRNDRYKEVQR